MGISCKVRYGLTAIILALAIRNAAAAPALEVGATAPFAAVRVDSKGDILPIDLEGALAGLADVPGPQHVVVLIHGWDTPLYASRKQYARISRDLQAEFASQHLQVGIIGLQWPSDAGPQRGWLPAAIARRIVGLLGFPHAVRDPYSGVVPVARATGRLGLRRLLFAVRDRFPQARLHLLTHSMGAEVALHAVRPQATPERHERAVVFSPERTPEVDLLALVGADLDEDVALAWKAPPLSEPAPSPRLWWLTVPSTGRRADRDRVLVLRKLARGRRAIGNVGPRLRPDQIDYVLRGRSLIFDTNGIPRDHNILNYYTRERLARLADAAGELQAPESHTSPLLETLGRVLEGPDDRVTLQPFLDSGDPTVTLYALWRLERRFCGDSRHLLNVDRLAHADPEQADKMRAMSPCHLVREGIWPTIRGRTGRGSRRTKS